MHELDLISSIPAAFFNLAAEQPDLMVYQQAAIDEGDTPDVARAWSSSTYSEVEQRVRKIAHFLRAFGLKRDSKAAILSSSRPEWMESDIGILTLGAISVSVYQSLPAPDVGYILFDSDTEIVFAENQEQVDKLIELLAEPILIPATEERAESKVQIGLKKIIAFEEVNSHPLVVQYSEIVSGDKTEEIDTYKSINRDDLAALVYTSGT